MSPKRLVAVLVTSSISSSLGFTTPKLSFVNQGLCGISSSNYLTNPRISSSPRTPFSLCATNGDDDTNANGTNSDTTKKSTVVNGSANGASSKINGSSASETDDSTPQLNSETISKKFDTFVKMSYPYFEESISGRWLFAGLIGLTFLKSGVSVAFSYVGRDFWTALSSKETEEFYSVLVKYSAALAVGAPVAALYRWQRERLTIAWREWMTNRVLSLYYSNKAYYALERNSEIDNPDQRLTEDVRAFTTFSLTFFLSIITSSIDLVSFSSILYSIKPELFGAIIAYASFGTLTTAYLGKSLVPLNFEKLQKEADFRYALVRIRENAESIAFYKGESIEGREIQSRFDRVLQNKRDIISTERNLDFFTTAYAYFIQILPVAVVAPQFFAGTIALGVVSQSSSAFNHILNDLSIIINQFESLSAFSAGIDRLGGFMEAIRDADPERNSDTNLMKFANTTDTNTTTALAIDNSQSQDSEPLIADIISMHYIPSPDKHIALPGATATNDILSIQNLTLVTPDRRRRLLQNLSFNLKSHQNLLIVGNSGAGKSSLLRAISGLWNTGSGSILRPSDRDVYFLPQRPYCVLGTLKDQLLYPLTEMEEGIPSDEELLTVLDKVNLSSLPPRFADNPIDGLYTVRDWTNTLSLGEQQRIAFARLLVNQPRLVILDEATSAMDMVTEGKMYGLLNDMEGATYVSVGHRPSLLNYHDVRLRVMGEEGGGCCFETIDRVEKNAVLVENL